jgi:hypothetical protein
VAAAAAAPAKTKGVKRAGFLADKIVGGGGGANGQDSDEQLTRKQKRARTRASNLVALQCL